MILKGFDGTIGLTLSERFDEGRRLLEIPLERMAFLLELWSAVQ
jgi:hypothetical protein